MNMDYEEKYIQEKMGQRNPFRVPEGYFDQLADQVMAQLPERQRKSRVVALRPWLYAAASVVLVVVMSLTFYFHRHAGAEMQTAAVATAVSTEESSYIDEAADYAMLDNVEIYALLAEN